MRNHSGANHVQLDINKTTLKVLVSLDGRGMIAVFPECAVASFALIVFLATAASDQLHAIADNLWTGVSNQKVNVVAGQYVSSTDRPKRFFASKPSADRNADRSFRVS